MLLLIKLIRSLPFASKGYRSSELSFATGEKDLQ